MGAQRGQVKTSACATRQDSLEKYLHSYTHSLPCSFLKQILGDGLVLSSVEYNQYSDRRTPYKYMCLTHG